MLASHVLDSLDLPKTKALPWARSERLSDLVEDVLEYGESELLMSPRRTLGHPQT